MNIALDKAKALLDGGIAEAQELIKEPSKVDDLLIQLENKLRDVPAIGETLSDLPLMISMVKGYITKEYTEVSPKVIVTMIAAFLYLIKKKDLIADNIPVIGIADDLGVLGLALKLSEPELNAYKAFRDGKKGFAEAAEADEPAEEAAADEPVGEASDEDEWAEEASGENDWTEDTSEEDEWAEEEAPAKPTAEA